MDISMGFIDLLKLASKLVQHKILQYRLTTNETKSLQTEDGKIKGVRRLTIYDNSYYSFEGIPYAQPPLGELRFRAPQPPTPWKGVKDCTQCRSKPLQRHMLLNITEGSEDCLYLNVYAKQLESSKPLPVLVWFYGGGFQIGEATRDNYSPDYFMREDVVLVTVNYRLGALGFLSLADPDLDVPGNAGLKDQLLALRWVKANIAHFNGDANNITIFGESAGAAATHYMMLAEQAQGLFHKAILQSGTALCPWATVPHKHWAYRLARALGYKNSNNDKEVFRFLSKLDATKLIGADQKLLSTEEKNDFMIIAFGPVVEPYVSAHCLIPKEPRELMRTSWSNELPVLMGGCSFEGLFSYRNRSPARDLSNCERLVPSVVRQLLDVKEEKCFGLKLRQTYFGDKDPSDEDSIFQYLDALSYKYFWHGIHRTLCSRLAYAAPTAPTYLYRFDFDSPTFNLYRNMKCGRNVRGVSHGDDIFYLFYNIPSWKLDPNSAEFKTIDRMIGMWTSFAANSDPNCAQIAPIVWQPAVQNDDTHKCLNISERVEFVELPEMSKLRVWDSLYDQELLY